MLLATRAIERGNNRKKRYTSNDANAADDGGFFPARPRTVLLKGTRNEIIASYPVG